MLTCSPNPDPVFTHSPQYVKWVNTNDPEEMWRVEVACTQYDYKMDRDIFKG